MFAYEHRYFACMRTGESLDTAVRRVYDRMYDDTVRLGAVESPDRAFIESDLAVPALRFNSVSCTGTEFVRRMDEATGASSADGQTDHGRPDIMVFATGDDYRNIELANACIRDVANERSDGNGSFGWQLFIVNVRDARNNSLLLRPDQYIDKLNLKVVIIGNTADVFSYDNIVDHRSAQMFNAAYNCLYEASRQGYASLETYREMSVVFSDRGQGDHNDEKTQSWVSVLRAVLSGRATHETARGVTDAAAATESETLKYNAQVFKDMQIFETWQAAVLRNSTDEILDRSWATLPLFGKASSRASAAYAKLLSARLPDTVTTKDCFRTFRRLVRQEHARWCRFHIANGWQYGGSATANNELRKDTLRRAHPCLTPMKYIPLDTVLFDLINVVMAYNVKQV